MYICERCKCYPQEYESDFCGECRDIMAWFGMGAFDTVCVWIDSENIYERMKNGETWQQVNDDYIKDIRPWSEVYAEMERRRGYKFSVA